MKQEYFSEQELRSAASQLQDAMLAGLPEESDHVFSLEFLAKMEALFRRIKRRDAFRQLGRWTAAVIIAVLLSGAALISFDPELRAAFFSWTREIFDNSAEYSFTGEYEGALPTLRPSWLPEGYFEADVIENYNDCLVVYKNEENNMILFTYSRISENQKIFIESTAFEHKEIFINNYLADIYIPTDKSESTLCRWIDENIGIVYSINSVLEETIILHIAESVHLVK